MKEVTNEFGFGAVMAEKILAERGIKIRTTGYIKYWCRRALQRTSTGRAGEENGSDINEDTATAFGILTGWNIERFGTYYMRMMRHG